MNIAFSHIARFLYCSSFLLCFSFLGCFGPFANPSCGDGFVDQDLGETCDDGNNEDFDGCSATCIEPLCNDGISSPGEVCFDTAVKLKINPANPDEIDGHPHFISIADLNGDNAPDLVTPNLNLNNAVPDDGEVSVFLNDGKGGFPSEVRVPVGNFPLGSDVGDIDDDGDIDIIVANANEKALKVLFNDGTGNFDGIQAILVLPEEPTHVKAVDLDNDQDLDLVALLKNDNKITILLNDKGVFTQETISAGIDPEDLRLGDISGDGILDIVVSQNGEESVGILLNDGFGSFSSLISVQIDSVSFAVELADFDGNGTLDIAATSTVLSPDNQANETVSILLNQGNLEFALQNPLIAGATPFFLLAADLDQNGLPELIVSNHQSDSISVFSNLGEGKFASAINFNTPDFGPNRESGLGASDLDQDGFLDFILAHTEDSSLILFRNTP